MIVLGLGYTYHEASAALVVDGIPVAAIARERLTRLKKDGAKWGSGRLDLTVCCDACLRAAGLTLNDVDLVAWSHYDHAPATAVFERLMAERGFAPSTIANVQVPHHFAHAASALYTSPFEDAAILVVDGQGGTIDGIQGNCCGPECDALTQGGVPIQVLPTAGAKGLWELESFYIVEGGTWRVLRKIAGDWAGIGAAYGMASKVLFGDLLHAGKTMGLASYGRPWTGGAFLGSAGTPDAPAFVSLRPWEQTDAGRQVVRWVAENPGRYDSSLVADFAAGVQLETEEALLNHVRWLRARSGQVENLCFAGGVAMNSVANGRLASEAGFANVYVPPCPGDDGIALGCALYGAATRGDRVHNPSFVPFLGEPHTMGDATSGLVPESIDGSFLGAVADRLAAGAVVAWYHGRSELGPRALGNRSFLADPRSPTVRDHLNTVIKNRESFRPFAPVVLVENVLDYFDSQFPSRFMSFVGTVREDRRASIPAVTHVDGTARYQVLSRSDNPKLYDLIREFAHRTGVPMLLNTSLNRAGEPLVETPHEAVTCFKASSADYLAMNESLYRRIS